MKTARLALAVALCLGAATASASSLSISPAAATALPGAGNATTPTPINVAYDNAGYTAGNGDAIDAEVAFDATKLSVAVTGNCSPTGGNGSPVIIAAADAGSNTIASGSICVMTFTTTAGAALNDVINLTFQNVSVTSGGLPEAVQPTLAGGAITISAAPPIQRTVTASGGAGGNVAPASQQVNDGSTANVTATPNAGFQVTAISGCGAGTPSPALPSASPVVYTTAAVTADCAVTATFAAVPAPVLASTPANGTTLSCNGAPGNVVNTQATIQNTGNANMTGVSCSVSGAGFALQTAPTGTIAAGGSSNAVVACTVPATGTATGTLSCTTTAPAGGALSFPLSSSGQTVPVFVEPDIIPTNSLWSKLGLVGLLAVLGLVAVGFRRQQ